MSRHPDLLVKLVNPLAKAPTRAHEFGDAGLDLYSSVDVTVPPLSWQVVSTGLILGLPPDTYGRIAPRSGLALKYGIDVFAGVVDEAFRGEICVVLMNHSGAEFEVKTGDKIAQLIIERIYYSKVKIVDSLPPTDRDTEGFGSSGFRSNEQKLVANTSNDPALQNAQNAVQNLMTSIDMPPELNSLLHGMLNMLRTDNSENTNHLNVD